MKQEFVRAVPVLEQLEQGGYLAYFVGGSVRDSIMGKEIHDVDIATSATPLEVKEIFGHTIDVGIEHGTVLVFHEGVPYEVTTFRTESTYKDFRRPDQVEFVTSLREDLKRRDFTMNAIAMDKDGCLYDPFCGREDIENQIIRTVGSPDERFSEDALRMVRAVRFISQLGFEVEENTYRALSEKANLLSHIAQERKTAEFQKLLSGKKPKEALRVAASTQILNYYPELDKFTERISHFLSLEVSECQTFEEWLSVIALTSSMNESMFKEWKLPVAVIKRIKALLLGYERRKAEFFTRYQLYELGIEAAHSIERVWAAYSGQPAEHDRIDDLYAKMPIQKETPLSFSGNDLIKWSGKKGGPWIKETMKDIIQGMLDGEIVNEKEFVKRWLIQGNNQLKNN
ncbi:CCA tRNA nucleotidyltransferase [Pradoshia eiseniae]|uniref:CCA-adding enzyme n=1 Tax=Pradoshia eiseniae TaxID=2064768 RepID=A0A2S7N4P3_9BACI|nr:CCA tRNA nucleotidyltransferase [Pradoshia eiseniae]PQD96930.1 CCA tRNA nucleotidyltransferase [Pradoshia eiseniae]